MKYLIPLTAALALLFTACNKEPDVSFSSSSTEIVAGEKINFTNGSDKNTYNAQWSFGDGGSASTWDASHVFQEAGTYTVTLSGTSKRGNKNATATQTITVKNRPSEEPDPVDPELSDKMIGTWTMQGALISNKPCFGSTTTIRSTEEAKKLKFVIVNSETAYHVRPSGEHQHFSIRLMDDKTATVSGFDVPTNNGAETYFSNGIYTITLSDTKFTFSRVVDTYFPSQDCYETKTYSFELKK